MRKWKRTIGAALMAALCSMSLLLPCTAAEAQNTEKLPTATVENIKVVIDVEGDLPEETETLHVQLKPAERDNPMPEGTEGGVYDLAIEAKAAQNEAVLPAITFDHAGIYRYTISQEKGKVPWGEYDKSAYTLKVTIENDETTGGLKVGSAVLRYATDEEEKDNKKDAAVFYDRYKVGTLVISNAVYGNKADPKKDFVYTLTLTAPEEAESEVTDASTLTVNYGTLLRSSKDAGKINGTYDGVTFVNGVATFTLRHGESKTFTQIPDGTKYKVVESDYAGYTPSVKVNDGMEVLSDTAEGTIEANETEKVAYRNGRSGSDGGNVPSYEPTPEPEPITDTTNIAVGKVWLDSDNADGIRPSSVTVQLYRNGAAYGNPVTLSEANDWWYRWDHLEKDASWTVDELNVPEGYEKGFTKNAVNAWVIVNTHEAKAAPVGTDTTGDGTHTNAYTGDESHMILWLVVMVVAGAGAAAGFVIYRKRRQR